MTTRTEIRKIRLMLEQREAELIPQVRNREGITIDKSADPMDEIQYASERELAIRSVDRDSTLLGQVRAALQRIESGNYGNCVECDWLISPRRLAALPWTPLCLECQQASDSLRDKGAEFGMGHSLSLSNSSVSNPQRVSAGNHALSGEDRD